MHKQAFWMSSNILMHGPEEVLQMPKHHFEFSEVLAVQSLHIGIASVQILLGAGDEIITLVQRCTRGGSDCILGSTSLPRGQSRLEQGS